MGVFDIQTWLDTEILSNYPTDLTMAALLHESN